MSLLYHSWVFCGYIISSIKYFNCKPLQLNYRPVNIAILAIIVKGENLNKFKKSQRSFWWGIDRFG